MTGIERLRALANGDASHETGNGWFLTAETIESIAGQIERETLPRPRFEDGEPAQWGEKYEEADYVGTVDHICYSWRDERLVCRVWGNESAVAHMDRGPLKRPEPPDSWERVEADVNKGSACRYFGVPDSEEECGKCTAQWGDYDLMSCAESMARDVLRRCKKLAGVE